MVRPNPISDFISLIYTYLKILTEKVTSTHSKLHMFYKSAAPASPASARLKIHSELPNK
jgi:hypothetical protein